MWTTITALDGALFEGKVLNAPDQLTSVRQHQAIRFVVDAGTGYAVMVTDKYLQERPRWRINACGKCGFAELFDAPSDLIRATFSNLPEGATMDAFTALCALCGDVQTVEAVEPPAASPPPAKRAWWKRG